MVARGITVVHCLFMVYGGGMWCYFFFTVCSRSMMLGYDVTVVHCLFTFYDDGTLCFCCSLFIHILW